MSLRIPFALAASIAMSVALAGAVARLASHLVGRHRADRLSESAKRMR